MVSLTTLLLPILLAAVVVFVASSLIHMVLKYHQSDYRQLPEEEKLIGGLRPAGLTPGLYHFPFCTHKDMNKGPVISSNVGRLMACTTPQKCPLLSPRSRYHLPPGQASSFIGMGPLLGPPLYGPNCSSRAVNVASSDARTWISSVMPSVKSSILVAVEIIFPPWNKILP